MPAVDYCGYRFTMRVVSSVTQLEAEEHVDTNGQAFIAATVGEEFVVRVTRTKIGGRQAGIIKCRLWLDGNSPGYFCFKAAESTTFYGYWKDGTGRNFSAFRFGEPGEGARGNKVDALKIEIEVFEVEDTGVLKPNGNSYKLPDFDKNRCKKFFQPHIATGADVKVSGAQVKVAATEYRRLRDSSFVSLRYATVDGLRILRLLPYPQPQINASEDTKPPRVKRERHGDDDVKHEKKPRSGGPTVIDLTT
ncbi:hypothetical protein CTAYLR_010673 [Chrysophaeum taylorii]|uniref:Uncharacterized protein n=1 Tax=Chrysophaeum taylorii TaxID=2483200 RepID=A0AAD7XHV6_9STRA|nr:hypothetical protein CTAYLR_010673 [Chrysophaeum taylorii]